MKIVQISTVVEHYMKDGEFVPYEEATVYGLGDDNKVYYYAKVDKKKSFMDKLDGKDDKEIEQEWGWRPYGT